MALDIGLGDEVITTPFTFIATVETIVLLGAKPVFVDVEAETANIDAGLIESKISERTKAILPVSLYGQVADMSAINEIAGRHSLPVIEDAAQSFGATYQGKRSCGISTIGITSFFPSKPLGCYGDGGAMFTDDDTIAQACREIRVHGQSARYVHTRVGVGGRMDTLQCAVVLAKWPRFEWEVTQRERIGARYSQLITAAHSDARTLTLRSDRSSVYAQYTVLVPDRESVQTKLKDVGIPTAVHYPIPLNLQPAYKDLCCPDCTPVSERLGKEVVSLPMCADLSDETQEIIVDALLESIS
jgi:UDP-2-acetamido-2-deoxy-ribo-hexuluronate aminotransferase